MDAKRALRCSRGSGDLWWSRLQYQACYLTYAGERKVEHRTLRIQYGGVTLHFIEVSPLQIINGLD